MATTVFGFYDIDAAPQHSVTGDLAERLGGVTGIEGFIDGSVFVRSDEAAAAIALQHDGGDDWAARPEAAALLDAANWRSRSADVAAYRSVRAYASGGDEPGDGSVFVVQRFVVSAAKAEQMLEALGAYVERYAQPVSGFLGAELYASVAPGRAVLVTPWEYEAALAALESPESLAAMHGFLDLADLHTFGTYQRVSYLRGGGLAS